MLRTEAKDRPGTKDLIKLFEFEDVKLSLNLKLTI